MPMRLVHIQFTVVRPMRDATGIRGVTANFASKLSAPLSLMEAPVCSFFRSDGYPESTQKYSPMPSASTRTIAV